MEEKKDLQVSPEEVLASKIPDEVFAKTLGVKPEELEMMKDLEAREKVQNKPQQGTLKEVPMKKDEKGNPLPVVQHDGLTRQQRRAEKQRDPHRNAKNNKARRVQTAAVTIKHETKFGPITEETGYKRKIVHSAVKTKLQKDAVKKQDKILEAWEKQKLAQKKAKENESEGNDGGEVVRDTVPGSTLPEDAGTGAQADAQQSNDSRVE